MNSEDFNVKIRAYTSTFILNTCSQEISYNICSQTPHLFTPPPPFSKNKSPETVL